MTISTTIIKNSYSGNGSTTAFTYNFKIAINTEIEVIVKTNATGAESIRSLGSGSANYGVSGVGNNSGTVTFVTGSNDTDAKSSYGIGFSKALGGGATLAGAFGSANGNDVADLGISLSF